MKNDGVSRSRVNAGKRKRLDRKTRERKRDWSRKTKAESIA